MPTPRSRSCDAAGDGATIGAQEAVASSSADLRDELAVLLERRGGGGGAGFSGGRVASKAAVPAGLADARSWRTVFSANEICPLV